MRTVAAAFRNELLKIFWRGKYWIMLAVYAAIGLGAGIIGASGYSLRLITELTFAVTGPNVVYGVLSAYRSYLIPLAVFMLCADVFTSELETKSIKCALTRPVGRFDIYLAKCLAILCYAAISLGVGYVVAQIWQLVTVVYANVAPAAIGAGAGADPVISGYQLYTGTSYAALFLTGAEALASYALTLIPMAAFVAYASFVSVVIRSPALVMFLCIASYLAFAFLGTLYNGVGAALFTTYTSWYRMWLGERLPLRSLAVTAGLLFSTCVAFFGFGYFIFEKKDI